MPRSSATVRHREKLTRPQNLLGPWTTTWSKQVNSISLQCIMWPTGYSLLWVRYLFDRFSISDFGGKWPLKWKLSKMSFRIPRQDTELRFVTKFGENLPLRSSRKVAWFTKQKKTLVPQDSSQLPFCPRWADRAQNALNPLTCPGVPNLVGIGCVLPDLFRIDFLAQKVNAI